VNWKYFQKNGTAYFVKKDKHKNTLCSKVIDEKCTRVKL